MRTPTPERQPYHGVLYAIILSMILLSCQKDPAGRPIPSDRPGPMIGVINTINFTNTGPVAFKAKLIHWSSDRKPQSEEMPDQVPARITKEMTYQGGLCISATNFTIPDSLITDGNQRPQSRITHVRNFDIDYSSTSTRSVSTYSYTHGGPLTSIKTISWDTIRFFRSTNIVAGIDTSVTEFQWQNGNIVSMHTTSRHHQHGIQNGTALPDERTLTEMEQAYSYTQKYPTLPFDANLYNYDYLTIGRLMIDPWYSTLFPSGMQTTISKTDPNGQLTYTSTSEQYVFTYDGLGYVNQVEVISPTQGHLGFGFIYIP